MRGASRASLAEAKERLTALADGPEEGAPALADELFAVVRLLDGEPALRRALTDPTGHAGAKEGLVRGLLGDRLAPVTLDLLISLVQARWSSPRDLADAAEQLAVLAVAARAEAGGQLDDLEDELFRFGRVVAAEPGLRFALSDPYLPARQKHELLGALLGGRVTPLSFGLITEAAIHPRGHSLDRSLAEYARLVAERRERLVAVVRVATGLTPQQRGRLAAALSAAYGHEVHLNIVLDPAIMGGMSVQIGDELIDASVAGRLAELRRRLAS
jgi:F-type H+-transporting ATPase subunit delta